MLLRFGVSNHRSVRDYQEFSFVASSLKDQESGLLNPMESVDAPQRFRCLPVLALYGANAAGKSAFIDAIDTLVAGIVWSQGRAGSDEGTPHDPFKLDLFSRDEASQYDVDFLLESVRYHYGFKMNAKIITEEWLYSYPLDTTRQTRSILFHRNAENSEPFYFGKSLKGDNKRIAKLVRRNSLFLSAAAQNAHPQLLPIYNFFYKKVSRRLDTRENDAFLEEQLFRYFANDSQRYARLIEFLQAADVGIAKIDFSKVPIPETQKKFRDDLNQVLVKHLTHSGDIPGELLARDPEETKVELLHIGEGQGQFAIPLDRESSGTRSLLNLLGPVLSKLTDGGVLIIDELNVALHPLISRELIRLFSSPESNPGKAQLVFSTHDTSLLTAGLLRRDQIWFAEKDHSGATYIYPLSSIKVRATDNIERGYIAGRFGAIPFITADLSSRNKLFNAHELEQQLKDQGLDKEIDEKLKQLRDSSDLPGFDEGVCG